MQKYDKPISLLHQVFRPLAPNLIRLRYTNLNGKIIEAENAMVSADNRAFRYGYGLFETMLIKDGKIALASYHWERLTAGLKALHLELPKLLTIAILEEEVLKTIRKNKLDQLCRVRLQLYADDGGLFDGKSRKPQYIIECYPLEEHIYQLNEAGLVMGIAEGLAKANDSIANHKTTNALVYALAAQQAKENKWNDALILNSAGNIIETTIANIFWIKDNIIYTPPLSEGCISGVMRRYIMERTEVQELPLTQEVLKHADGVFISNAIRRIKWVAAIGDYTYSKNAVVAFANSMKWQ